MDARDPICSCISASHERTGCRHRRTLGVREELFAGLFDTGARAQAPARPQLLNPAYGGDDRTCRRFALLEID